jgi:branched-chain amino acid transport system permease protein
MEIYLQFILLGIGSGVVFAALALGLVLTHRASGVVNFAHGAIAMYVTYVYSSLKDDGAYPVPPLPNPFSIIEGILSWVGITVALPDLPTFIQMGEEWPWWAAMLGAVITAGIIGFLFHYLVFRVLRYQPPLAKVVSSVGLMLILQAAVVIRFSNRARNVESLLPNDGVDVLGTTVPMDRFILFGLMILATTVLYLVYQKTKFGIMTRAAAENEQHATLLGISADAIAAVNWIVAAMLAGVVGILAAPITGLNPLNMTLFIIPALGAALVARFSSFWVAVWVGMGIGAGQSLLQIMEVRLDWIPDINLSQGLPLVVIVIAMMVRGQVLPSRGAVERGRLPLALPTRIRPTVMIVWLVLTSWLLIWGPFEWRQATINTLIAAILAMSLVVVTGYVGQISLAQLSLAGIAAFMLSSLATDAGIPFPIAPLLAALVATGFGLIVAIPALRVRGASLAIMTLAAGVAIEVFLFKSDGWLAGDSPRRVADPSLFGIEFGPNSPFWFGDGKVPSPAFGLFVLTVLTVCFIAVIRLRQSMLGAQMLAVRANERAAAAAGVNVQGIKLAAFGISSFLAGVGGTLTAYKFGTYSMESFAILASLSLFAFSYLGGIATVAGAIYAGTLYQQGIGTLAFEKLFFDLGRYEAYLAGIFLVITALVQPQGIDVFDRRERRRIGWGFVKLWRKATGNPDRTKPEWVTRIYPIYPKPQPQTPEVPDKVPVEVGERGDDS